MHPVTTRSCIAFILLGACGLFGGCGEEAGPGAVGAGARPPAVGANASVPAEPGAASSESRGQASESSSESSSEAAAPGGLSLRPAAGTGADDVTASDVTASDVTANDVSANDVTAGADAAAGAVDAGAPLDASREAGDGGRNAGAADAGAPPGNDCCTASPVGSCTDPSVAACVCEGDPFCCSGEYDDVCVAQAASRCGLDCDLRPPVSDCCSPSDVPGCTLPELADCICDIDPFCCVFRFDQNCVNLGTSQCAAACGEAGAIP